MLHAVSFFSLETLGLFFCSQVLFCLNQYLELFVHTDPFIQNVSVCPGWCFTQQVFQQSSGDAGTDPVHPCSCVWSSTGQFGHGELWIKGTFWMWKCSGIQLWLPSGHWGLLYNIIYTPLSESPCRKKWQGGTQCHRNFIFFKASAISTRYELHHDLYTFSFWASATKRVYFFWIFVLLFPCALLSPIFWRKPATI